MKLGINKYKARVSKSKFRDTIPNSKSTLNNTYKCAHINRLISPLILVRSFFKFSTNDMCVIKLHLFYLRFLHSDMQ